ncbi:hypothetical protein PACTADRAFT_77075 [Pachysolen tannophilus NRRL Y-2460]|uniref:Mediator of RNA polymerase II transcription subunit 9 n=1 Tax=Pachysolen tannophilus NRRL Y-2460 TaxID=669874 RepID=A0A1E4TRV2_PACTA|nr:hypothetical protein PACTADRAFT_77075 [Pachysolen tannophilus NRRL Y-2460]
MASRSSPLAQNIVRGSASVNDSASASANASTSGSPKIQPQHEFNAGSTNNDDIDDGKVPKDIDSEDEKLLQKLENAHESLKEIKQMELIPVLLELIEDVKKGKLSPKDFENAAGRLRIRIAKIKALLCDIDGLDESHEERISRINRVNENIEKKKSLLLNFRESVGERIQLPELKLELDQDIITTSSAEPDAEPDDKADEKQGTDPMDQETTEPAATETPAIKGEENNDILMPDAEAPDAEAPEHSHLEPSADATVS